MDIDLDLLRAFDLDFDSDRWVIENNPKISFLRRIINSILSMFSSIRTLSSMFSYSHSASELMDMITEIYHNTMVTLIYIFFIVISVIFITIYYFNSRVNINAKAFHKRVEYILDALFVILPIIIVYCLSLPAVGFILTSDNIIVRGTNSSFDLEIIGHQWYWTYYINAHLNTDIYELITHFLDFYKSLLNLGLELDQFMVLDSDVEKRCFEVNKYLVLPVGETIRCDITSADVIHSWALPQLGIKVDAIPGRIQTFYLRSYVAGAVFGQCSELCGENHAFMPIIIEFVELSVFIDWLLKSLEYNPYALYLNTILVSL